MDALTDTLVAERLAEGKKAPYIVPVGGSSPLGTAGFVNAAFELAGQIAAGQLPEPDYIYAADGTNGTVAGLMIGLKALGLKTQVIPVRVNDESRVNVAAISQLIDDTVALLRGYDPSFPAVHIPAEDIPLLHDFFGSDYALFTEEGVAALRRMNAMFGIQLEGTYTGKTLAALLAAAEKTSGKTFLFWNTLNSRPSPDGLETIDYRTLPTGFHSYFETPVQPLDR